MRILTGILAAMLWVNICCAQERDTWRSGQYYKLLVQGEPLTIRSLLSDFGQRQRVPVIVDEGVTGEVTQQYPKSSPEDYLNALTSDNNLFWFEKNGIILVSPASKLESRVIPLGGVDPSRIIDVLRGFQLYSESFPPKFQRDLGLGYFTGTADYLTEVERIIGRVAQAAGGDPAVEVGVEVYYLEYAWADDRSFTFGETQIVVPGVATILRNVLTGETGAVGFQGRVSYQLPYNRAGLRGAGLIGPYNQLLVNTQQAAIDSQVAAAEAEARFQATANAQQQIDRALDAIEGADPGAVRRGAAAAGISPVIQAEPRLNAIIIKDVRERLDYYQQVIDKLDHPVSLVEITASIIDVDATYGVELGLPWNLRFNKDGVQRSILGNISTTSLASVAAPGNLTFQLADGAVNQFFMNLRALESEGHARMLANPTVVTLDNQDAFLEESEEFFVRVEGNEQVDLFNVTVGTKLVITPHVIHDPATRQIRLIVNVEDGSRSATDQVDAIPVVSRNSINTQAVLLEGQSLLIGGLTREREIKRVRAVPFLGRIPKIGAAFRETVHETARLERLILLKPTIIDLPCYTRAGISNGEHRPAMSVPPRGSTPRPTPVPVQRPYEGPEIPAPPPALPAENPIPFEEPSDTENGAVSRSHGREVPNPYRQVMQANFETPARTSTPPRVLEPPPFAEPISQPNRKTLPRTQAPVITPRASQNTRPQRQPIIQRANFTTPIETHRNPVSLLPFENR